MFYVKNKLKKRLSNVKKGVISTFGKGKPEYWKNREFENLSFQIKIASRILISPATLKRIFGKQKTSETYYPQESTLDALERYVRVKNPVKKNILFRTRTLIYSCIIILFVIASILFLNQRNNDNNTEPLKAELILSKIDGTNPATAFFSYQLPESNDSIFITFGDNSEPVYLPPQSSTISHYYRYPGNFEVTIKSKGNIISDRLSVYIKTTGWKALASYYEQDYSERFFPVPIPENSNTEGFHPTKLSLANIGIDTTQIVVLRLDNFKSTNTNGDSFTLRTRLKNISYWPAIRCYSVFIRITGENANISFRLTNQGCSQFGELILGEKIIYGTHADLTGFTMNTSEWMEVVVKNNTKNVSIQINQSEIFNGKYEKTIGEILGVSLQFHGSGYINYYTLLDDHNRIIFNKTF